MDKVVGGDFAAEDCVRVVPDAIQQGQSEQNDVGIPVIQTFLDGEHALFAAFRALTRNPVGDVHHQSPILRCQRLRGNFLHGLIVRRSSFTKQGHCARPIRIKLQEKIK